MKPIYIVLIILLSNVSLANEKGNQTGLELPRYVSLKSNESNIRVGPSQNYPILVKYVTRNFPLKVTDEYEDWRKTIDFHNNTGWIHKSLIKGERRGIIISDNKKIVHIYNVVSGSIIGEIEIGAIIKLSKCKINWCLVSKESHKGWVKKMYIWGVDSNEEFNINIFQNFIDYYFKSLNFIKSRIYS